MVISMVFLLIVLGGLIYINISLADKIKKLEDKFTKLEAGLTRLELEGIYKNEIDYGARK